MQYFFVGIGGIGMSALAQLLQHEGHTVLGSDRASSPTTNLLEEKGVQILFAHESLPLGVDVLVYSDAVPEDNAERMSAHETGVPQKSYFMMLGEVTRGRRTIAVAGTHGKTTTTGMLAKILTECGAAPTAIVGSIVADFGSNFLAGDINGLFVVEACEYKNHLLNLAPEVLIITNLELDHTDFFTNLKELQETFRKAIERVPAHGYIVTDTSDPNIQPLLSAAVATVVDYNTDFEKRIALQLPGEFNQANARAALVAAQVAYPGIDEIQAKKALETFRGSWRRFEFKGELPNGTLVYDDYAHHPTAVAKTIAAAREKWPDKKIIIAFHPHLYTRTKQFMREFAEALATADEVVLAPIYAAREPVDSSVSSDILAAHIVELGTPAQALDSLESVRLYLTTHYSPLTTPIVLITMGAGDIYKVAEELVDE